MSEYDPAKAHEYYERTKQLKGRDKIAKRDEFHAAKGAKTPPVNNRAEMAKRVKALNVKLASLREALKKASASSSPETKPSEGEQKSKDEARNKKYYNEHKNEIANDRKAEGGSSSSKSTPAASGTETRSVEELKSAIRSTLTELKAAIAKLRTL